MLFVCLTYFLLVTGGSFFWFCTYVNFCHQLLAHFVPILPCYCNFTALLSLLSLLPGLFTLWVQCLSYRWCCVSVFAVSRPPERPTGLFTFWVPRSACGWRCLFVYLFLCPLKRPQWLFPFVFYGCSFCL